MKKYIAGLILSVMLVPSFVGAQTLNATEKASLIARIEAKIQVLIQEYYQLLAQEQLGTATTTPTQVTVTPPTVTPIVAGSASCIENPTLVLSEKDLYIASSSIPGIGNVVDSIDAQLSGTYSTGCAINKNMPWTLTQSTNQATVAHGTFSSGWPFVFSGADPNEGSPVANSGSDTLYRLSFVGNLQYQVKNWPVTTTLTIGNVSQSVVVGQ